MDAYSTVFRDEAWLAALGGALTADGAMQYFAASPFGRSGTSTDGAPPTVEFGLRLTACSEADGLFVIERRHRFGPGPDAVTLAGLFYVLHGSVLAVPDLARIVETRTQQSAAHLGRAVAALLRGEREQRAAAEGGGDATATRREREEAIGAAAGLGLLGEAAKAFAQRS